MTIGLAKANATAQTPIAMRFRGISGEASAVAIS
jgi:hypothetical protein